jgi:hypothetical protein
MSQSRVNGVLGDAAPTLRRSRCRRDVLKGVAAASGLILGFLSGALAFSLVPPVSVTISHPLRLR